MSGTIIIIFGFHYPVKFLYPIYDTVGLNEETEANGQVGNNRIGT